VRQEQLPFEPAPDAYDDLSDWAGDIHERVWPLLQGPDRALAMAAFLVAVADRGAVGRRGTDDAATFVRLFFADHLVDIAVDEEISVGASERDEAEYVGPLESLPRAVLLDAARTAEQLRYAQSQRTLAAAAERAAGVC
jgi:hypothetical protein